VRPSAPDQKGFLCLLELPHTSENVVNHAEDPLSLEDGLPFGSCPPPPIYLLEPLFRGGILFDELRLWAVFRFFSKSMSVARCCPHNCLKAELFCPLSINFFMIRILRVEVVILRLSSAAVSGMPLYFNLTDQSC